MEQTSLMITVRENSTDSSKNPGTSLPDRQAGSKLLASSSELGTLSSRKISALVGVAPLNRDTCLLQAGW